jgi:hypothetical protein
LFEYRKGICVKNAVLKRKVPVLTGVKAIRLPDNRDGRIGILGLAFLSAILTGCADDWNAIQNKHPNKRTFIIYQLVTTAEIPIIAGVLTFHLSPA